jgi:predicted Zn-dependent protease
LQRAHDHSRRGASLQAEQYLVAAWDAGLSVSEVLPSLLEVCLGAGRLQNARLHLERARREQPEDPYLPYLEARLLYALGRVFEALTEVTELTTNPEAPAEAWLFQGSLLLETGRDADQAESALSEFLRREPGPIASRQVRAVLHRMPHD